MPFHRLRSLLGVGERLRLFGNRRYEFQAIANPSTYRRTNKKSMRKIRAEHLTPSAHQAAELRRTSMSVSIAEAVIELAKWSGVGQSVKRASLCDASRGADERTPRDTRQCGAN
jgi:hypothetical protein